MQQEEEQAPEKGAEDSKTKKIIKLVLHILFHILFISYFIWATVAYSLYDKESKECFPKKPDNATNTTKVEEPWILCDINWCHGYGFLIILFVFFYIAWTYYFLFKPMIGKRLYDSKIEPAVDKWIQFSRKTLVSIIMLIIVIVLVVAFLAWECREDARKIIGLSAPVLFVLLGVAMSTARKQIPWRIVVHGLLGQLLLGIMCLRLALGRSVFECAGEKVTRFLGFAQYGARFVYGDRICDEFVFAFAILAVIFFFSVITSILYYLGAIQLLLGALGFLLQATVGTTVCESVNAVGNIFLGMSESPLLIRPYISILTLSELHTICVSGYATVAGTVLGAYISFGASPALLMTASVMAAPGSLAFAKLFYPETEESKTMSSNIELEKSPDKSILDAAASGAANALMIVLSIVSTMIAFLAILFFLNAVVEWMFELTGHRDITFIYLLTKLFTPLVFLMGVVWGDCEKVAMVVAEKTVINEFVGYKHLGDMINNNEINQRSAGIATFALCGFANPGSLGILIAALSVMAPDRRYDVTNVAVRAFLVGSIVSFTSASIAGILIDQSELDKISEGKLMPGIELLQEGEYLLNI